MDGRVVAHYGAAAKHRSFFPGAVVADFAGRLEGFDTSKGTMRFTPDHSIPAALVEALVKAKRSMRAGTRR